MDFGSAFHAGAEQVAKSLEVDPAGPYAAWLNLHRDWFQANCVRVEWTERVLVNAEQGYAGTADLLVEHQQHGLTLVDYKTQGVKPGNKARAYGSWCQQLAAYRRAIGKPMACLSVIVNSAEPSAPVEHLWSEEELRGGLLPIIRRVRRPLLPVEAPADAKPAAQPAKPAEPATGAENVQPKADNGKTAARESSK